MKPGPGRGWGSHFDPVPGRGPCPVSSSSKQPGDAVRRTSSRLRRRWFAQPCRSVWVATDLSFRTAGIWKLWLRLAAHGSVGFVGNEPGGLSAACRQYVARLSRREPPVGTVPETRCHRVLLSRLQERLAQPGGPARSASGVARPRSRWICKWRLSTMTGRTLRSSSASLHRSCTRVSDARCPGFAWPASVGSASGLRVRFSQPWIFCGATVTRVFD